MKYNRRLAYKARTAAMVEFTLILVAQMPVVVTSWKTKIEKINVLYYINF